MELNLNKFNPTVAQVTEMVAKTKSITATDLKDKKQIELIKSNRIELKNARVQITKVGKELRSEALEFQRLIIKQEKELLGIIEPEETRLESIEEEAKRLQILEIRKTLLPSRKEKLSSVGNETDDDQLLDMDENQFETYFNACVAAQNEKKRLEAEAKLAKEKEEAQAKLDEERKAFEAEKAKLEEENKKIEDEKRKIKAEKLAIQHAKELEEVKAKAKLEAEEKAKQELQDKIEADKKAAELKAKLEAEEKAKLEKRKAFIAFREKHGYSEATKDDFKTIETETGYDLFKKVGTFSK